jgi:NAD(P)-dependent dehydrogenase (short-subunit alcohol dehydrogenase family)
LPAGGTALNGSRDIFRSVMDVNFFGAVNGCQAFVPAMLEAGTDCFIVNTGSKQVPSQLHARDVH